MADGNSTENTLWGPEEAKKRCPSCEAVKPLSDFGLRRVKRSGRMERYSFCTPCQRLSRKRHYETHREKYTELARRRHLRDRFGLTLEDYERLLQSQGGACAICGKPERARNSKRRPKPLSIDHDHATGKVRSLLCQTCNTLIGMARESPEILRAAIAYLELHT